VRFMTIKRNRDLNRAMIIGSIFILVVVGGAFITGALSNVLFQADQGMTAIQVAGGNPDQVIPQFITTYMPQIFIYIFLLTLISAGISTSSAQFHTIGTALGKDIIEDNIKKGKKSHKNTLLWKRVGIAIAIVFTFLLGIYVLPAGIVAKGTAFFFAIAAGMFLAPVIGALFWRGATKAGAIWSMLVGLGISIMWTLVFNGGTLGIKSLTDIAPLKYMEPGIVGLVFSIIILFVVSAMTKKMPGEHISMCFAKDAPAEN
ncbi:MAG: sodium:solute symporter family protein, partial [Caldisericia bacterium]|nr:sodium:solute symporter family protein [Caldisericia bacterium]